MKATIILALALAFVGCKPHKQASQEAQGQEAQGQEPSKAASQEQEGKYTEASLPKVSHAYYLNSVRAESDYFGQVFTVRGVVVNITKKGDIVIVEMTDVSNMWRRLNTTFDEHGKPRANRIPDDDPRLKEVWDGSCMFQFAHDYSDVKKLNVGKEAKLSGKLSGYKPLDPEEVMTFTFNHSSVEK